MNIAVLIPCYNEEATVAKVITDFRKQLPSAEIYVYDNNSTDNTADVARKAGAIVRCEPRKGKGNVVRSMFQNIEADVYIMVDGDDTYPAESVHDLIEPIIKMEAEMVVGDRLSSTTYQKENKRPFHIFGNKLVVFFINTLFKASLHDVMSGYRSFSRFFVKTIAALSTGFEIETEIVLHALDKRFLIKEVPVVYRDRIKGSVSKLKTLEDGLKVLRTILWIFKDYRPLVFFGFWAFIFFLTGCCIGVPSFVSFFKASLITSVLFIVLSLFMIFTSMILLSVGLILDTVVKFHRLDYERAVGEYLIKNPIRLAGK